MNRLIAFAAVVLSAGAAFGQPQAPKQTASGKGPSTGHCEALPQSDHEVPVIIEDGSIRVLAYKSHFDSNLLSRITAPSRAKTMAPAKTAAVMDRLGSWHTHLNDHILQIAVSFAQISLGRPRTTPIFKTKLHHLSLDASDKVEIQLIQGTNAAGSVWLSKEPDSLLVSPCHHANTTASAQLLAWKLLGIGTLKVPRDGLGGSSEFVHLEYDPTSGSSGALQLLGVRIWSADPSKNPSAFIRAEVKLGSGCAAVQICPNDENGNPACKPMKPPCSLKAFKGRPIDLNLEFQK